VKKLTDGYAAGSLIKSGIPVVITGKPNAGKSSIMNLLSGQNRSIVTDIPGTTRDTIDGYITLSGYTLKLTDTAGLRETGDLAEKIGVERALEAVKTAAITLAVFDLGRTADENDELTLKNCETGQTIIIFNKTDEERALPDDFINALSEKHPTVFLSAKSGEGLSELKESLAKKLEENIMLSDTEAVLNERQFAAASAAEAALTRVVSAAKENAATDIISVLIFEATEHLSSLTGESVTESVADEIFSRFCVGK
jgi:tRNA modification GTPase